jgi:hypothetical protein
MPQRDFGPFARKPSILAIAFNAISGRSSKSAGCGAAILYATCNTAADGPRADQKMPQKRPQGTAHARQENEIKSKSQEERTH